MSKTREASRQHGELSEARALEGSPESAVWTPLFELVRGEGSRWAALDVLDVLDLDPPTPILPGATT